MADNALIRILTALLKHQVKKAIGDDALGVIGQELTAIGGDKLDEQVKLLLGEKSTIEFLEKAAEYVHTCFRGKVSDKDVEQWMIMLPLDNLPIIVSAIEELPTSPDESKLEKALRETISLSWSKLSPEQVNNAVDSYLFCLRSALLPIEKQAIPIIGRSMLRIEGKVNLLISHVEKYIVNAQERLQKVEKDNKKQILSSLPGLQVTPDLIAPYEQTSNEVVIGKTISIDHIRDQRFMLRKAILADALSALDLFLQAHANNFDPEVLTFWISGRSGSGKSVLLLHIMQEIILERGSQVIWLDDAAEFLPSLLEKWANLQTSLNVPLFVFVDDFNSPQARDKIDLKLISRLLRNPKFSRTTWPVLVTCSPPEYLEEFQKTGNEFFQIEKWSIPPVTKEEQLSFLEWFKTRTGDAAKSGMAFEQDSGLILSMMLELRHGNITEFARRFKERLNGSNLLTQMIQPLALNRLYIWAPANWLGSLTPEQHDALSALNLDKDFSVLNIENSPKKYIRLTHPHLSDAIYKSIRPDNFGHQRASDLANAFEQAVVDDDVLATRILLAIAQGGDRITKDINEKILAEKIAVYCDKFVQIVNKSHPVNLAFIWTNIAKWASREQYLDTLFPRSPLENAINALGSDHYSWGDLWLQLWACYPSDKRLLESGWNWVSNRFHWDETAWYSVWNTLLINSDTLPNNRNKTDVLGIGILWLNGREDHRWWSRVWENILENNNDIPSHTSVNKIIQVGAEWLKGREDSGQWSFVWEGILQYAKDYNFDNAIDEMLDYGINWLDGREDQLQWAFVWQGILKYAKYASSSIDKAKLLDIGVNWLIERESSIQWNYVWDDVTNNFGKSQPATKKKLIKWGLSWMSSNQDRKKWSIVYLDFAKKKYDREFKKVITVTDFISIGIEWIELHKEEDEASQVALYLMRSYQTNFQRPDLPPQNIQLYKRLVEITNLMVRKTPFNSPSLPFWLLCYWEIKPNHQTMQAILKWMETTNEDSEGARSIVNKLLSDQKPSVLNALNEWQKAHPQNPISEIIKNKFEKEISQQKDD